MRTLLYVQGINKKANYIQAHVEASGFDLSIYDNVEYVNTEQFFDEALAALPELLRGKMLNKCEKSCAIPDYEAQAEWMDYGIDVWSFFTNKSVYKKLISLVEERVKFYKDQGHDIHIIAHSLGTLITLHSDIKIEKLYSFASPIGFQFAPLRVIVKTHLWLRGKKCISNKTVNVWGQDDYISRQMSDGGDKVYRSRTSKYREYKVFTGHSLLDQMSQYLESLKKF